MCTANQQRSPTAEELFVGSEKYEAHSCGIHPFAEQPITRYAVQWADVIFCMEEIHKKFIEEYFWGELEGKEMIVLDIPDHYYHGEPELVVILREKLKSWLR